MSHFYRMDRERETEHEFKDNIQSAQFISNMRGMRPHIEFPKLSRSVARGSYSLSPRIAEPLKIAHISFQAANAHQAGCGEHVLLIQGQSIISFRTTDSLISRIKSQLFDWAFGCGFDCVIDFLVIWSYDHLFDFSLWLQCNSHRYGMLSFGMILGCLWDRPSGDRHSAQICVLGQCMASVIWLGRTTKHTSLRLSCWQTGPAGYIFVYLCVCLLVCLCVCHYLFACSLVCLCVCLFVWLLVCLIVCLLVCL